MVLPTNWATASLGDLVDIYDYARVPLNRRQRERARGPFPYYGANGIVDYVNDYIFDGTFILVAEDGGHFEDPRKAVATKVEGRFWVNNHAHVVRPKPEIDPAFLTYALRTVNWIEHVGGSTRLKLTQAGLKALPVPVTSAAEQSRLVRHLDRDLAQSERAGETLARTRQLVDAFRTSAIANALSGEATRRWREAAAAPDWQEVRLGDMVEGLKYGSSARSARSGAIPVLRMGNIQEGRLDWTDLAYTSDEREIERYRLTRGDVLFNRTNSPELVGKSALYDDDRPAIYAGYLIRISCGPDLNPAFLTHLLNGPDARAYFAGVRSDGVNQSNINATKLAELPFKAPSWAEQEEIVRQLERQLAWADEMRKHVASSRALLDQLKIGMVRKAFEGGLTSAQPDDEAVELLLARLSNEGADERAARLEADRKVLVKSATQSGSKRGRDMGDRGSLREDHLRKRLEALGGAADAADLWTESGLNVEDFYKQLRDEVAAGRVREGAQKGSLVTTDAA